MSVVDDLCDACRYGDVGEVSRLLSSSSFPDVNAKSLGGSAFHWASYGGHADVVRLLLAREELDASSATGDSWWTALHCAARHGHVDVARDGGVA